LKNKIEQKVAVTRDVATGLSSEKSYQGACIAVNRQPPLLVK